MMRLGTALVIGETHIPRYVFPGIKPLTLKKLPKENGILTEVQMINFWK